MAPENSSIECFVTEYDNRFKSWGDSVKIVFDELNENALYYSTAQLNSAFRQAKISLGVAKEMYGEFCELCDKPIYSPYYERLVAYLAEIEEGYSAHLRTRCVNDD